MALSARERREIAVEFAQRHGVSGNKTELIAMITAIDTWCDDNAASYNSTIPQPYRTSLTAQQKSALLGIVSDARVGAA